MVEFKTYIIRIIIISAIVQFGAIISGEKYKKIYSLVGGIFIAFSLISLPGIDMDLISFNNVAEHNLKSATISDKFTDNVSNKVKEEIMQVFEIDAIVNVRTDDSFAKIYITIECDVDDETKYRIEEYIAKTFCTPNDEVVVINE